MEEERPAIRGHGFGRPFHPLQVVSWFVFTMDVAVYAFVGLPLVEGYGTLIAVAVCYGVSVLIVVLATVRATHCNPADPRVLQPRGALEVEREGSDELLYCTICEVNVAPRSKHCRTCNKCVDAFDHHCIWLNNCIGVANYSAFFVTVCSVAVMTGILLSTCVYLLTDYIVNKESFMQRADSVIFLSSAPGELLLALTIALLIVNTPLFLLDMQLVLLHLFLMSQNLTTYEYIINKQDRLERDAEAKGAGRTENLGRLRNPSKRIRTLPRCMDWIVFSRCGQRRKKRQPREAKQASGEESTGAQGREPKELPAPAACEGGTPAIPHHSSAIGGSTSRPEPKALGTKEESSCNGLAKAVVLQQDGRQYIAELSPQGPRDQACPRPTGVLPEHGQQNAEAREEGGTCSAYSGITAMWRFILGLAGRSF